MAESVELLVKQILEQMNRSETSAQAFLVAIKTKLRLMIIQFQKSIQIGLKLEITKNLKMLHWKMYFQDKYLLKIYGLNPRF